MDSPDEFCHNSMPNRRLPNTINVCILFAIVHILQKKLLGDVQIKVKQKGKHQSELVNIISP